MIFSLDDPQVGEAARREVGNKAWRLMLLSRALETVPRGICLSRDAMSLLYAGEAGRFLATFVDMYLVNKVGLHRVLPEIRRRMAALPFPQELEERLREALESAHVVPPFAVRSSAPFEDEAAASWAGVLDTVLDVSLEGIAEAVMRCWCSLYTERVFMYLQQATLSRSDLLTGVIIQQMVYPEKQGVAFTINPVTRNRTEVVIETSSGAPTSVVSGAAVAGRYFYDTLSDRFCPEENPPSTLDESQLRAIVAAARSVERVLGREQDIEWAIQGGKVSILQSRPITALQDNGIDYMHVVAMQELNDENARYLNNLRGRYHHWKKKKIPFYRSCQDAGVPLCGWFFVCYRTSVFDESAFEKLVSKIHAPYVYLCVSENLIDMCVEVNALRKTLLWLAEAFDGHTLTVGVRECYPTEVSILSQLTADGQLYLEYGRGASKDINSGSMVPSSVVVDVSGTVEREERMQGSGHSEFDPRRLEFVEVPGGEEVRLSADDLQVVMQHTAALSRVWGKNLVVEWWKWRDVLVVTDASLVDVAGMGPGVRDSEYLVVSPGPLKGRLVELGCDDRESMEYMSHGRGFAVLGVKREAEELEIVRQMKDRIRRVRDRGEGVIAYAERPLTIYAPLVGLVDGFVFEHASLLCHLSIILREKRVPAVSLQGRERRVAEGEMFSTPGPDICESRC